MIHKERMKIYISISIDFTNAILIEFLGLNIIKEYSIYKIEETKSKSLHFLS